MAEAQSWMNLLRPSSPWIGFDADIGEAGLGPRLGFYQEHQCVQSGEPDLAELFSQPRIAALCEPSRWRGLRDWVGRQPAQPGWGQGRSLSLKLVFGVSVRPTLKAYVSTFDVPVAMRWSEWVGAPEVESSFAPRAESVAAPEAGALDVGAAVAPGGGVSDGQSAPWPS